MPWVVVVGCHGCCLIGCAMVVVLLVVPWLLSYWLCHGDWLYVKIVDEIYHALLSEILK